MTSVQDSGAMANLILCLFTVDILTNIIGTKVNNSI